MKTCPACQTQYTDDTLQFCLQDGTPLAAARVMETPTAVLKDPSAWQSQVTHIASAKPTRRSSVAIIVAATVLVMFVLFGAAGVGAWLYFRNPRSETANNVPVKAQFPTQIPSTNAGPTYTPPQSPSVAPSSTQVANVSTPANTVDESQVRNAVSQRLMSWKSTAESLDLDENIAHYAPRVEYYKRSGANEAFIRADKLRAFTRYDSIDIKLTNISISVDPAGQQATVKLDKEWNFEGDEGSSSGKVQQLLKLKKFNGEWLITAERDLKVYFTR